MVRRLGYEALTKIEIFGRQRVEDTEWISWADRESLVVLTKDDAIRRDRWSAPRWPLPGSGSSA
jgi:hypothetical protein